MNKVAGLLVCALIVLLSGCAAITPTSLPLASSDKDAEAKAFVSIPDKAVLYIYRDQFRGSAWQIPVTVNGLFIGKTGGYTYFRLALEPGQYVIESRAEKLDSITVTLDAGKVYFVRQKTRTGTKVIRTELQLVDGATGRDGVNKSRLLQ